MSKFMLVYTGGKMPESGAEQKNSPERLGDLVHAGGDGGHRSGQSVHPDGQEYQPRGKDQ